MGTQEQVWLWIISVGSLCGAWMVAYVFWPKFSKWYSRNLGDRLAKRMQWLDERDEELAAKRARKKKRHEEQREARSAQIAAGLLPPDPKDAGDAGMEQQWGDTLDDGGKKEEKSSNANEWDFGDMDPEEMMRKHCCEVDGVPYTPPAVFDSDDDEEAQRQRRSRRPKSANAAVRSPKKGKKGGKAAGGNLKNEVQETSEENLTIAQRAKMRLREMEAEKFKKFIEKMNHIMTPAEKMARGRQTFRHKLKTGPMGYQMPLGEHTNPTYGDLQERIQWMRHSDFLHKQNMLDRKGNRTEKSFGNYIDDMDTESALSLKSPMPKARDDD